MLSIGGFIHHKGFHDVIRVMPDLRRRFSGIQLCIIGESRDARYASYLEQLIAIEGLSECVSLVRNASDATKSAALSEADIYVQPSHEEGFCLAFAEAAAIAPRLVGTRTGEIPGFASDDPSAIVVAPKRPLDLLNAITTLVESDSHSKSAKSRGIRLAERYTWSSYVSKHVATYRGQPGN
jgi:glycosyltransferase involved in cell wall biosynthesis